MTSFNAHKRPRIDRRETMEWRRIEITMYTRARTHTHTQQHTRHRGQRRNGRAAGNSPNARKSFARKTPQPRVAQRTVERKKLEILKRNAGKLRQVTERSFNCRLSWLGRRVQSGGDHRADWGVVKWCRRCRDHRQKTFTTSMNFSGRKYWRHNSHGDNLTSWTISLCHLRNVPENSVVEQEAVRSVLLEHRTVFQECVETLHCVVAAENVGGKYIQNTLKFLLFIIYHELGSRSPDKRANESVFS